MNIKKRYVILVTFISIYNILIIVHCFFNTSLLNKELSSQLFLAQSYAFVMLISCFMCVISVIGIFLNKHILKISACFILVGSLILGIFGVNHEKQVQNKETDGIKIVEWNAENNIQSKDILKIFKELDADIAVLPECTLFDYDGNNVLKSLFNEVQINFEEYAFFVSEENYFSEHVAPVTVIIKKSFANYTIFENQYSTTLGTIYLKSIDKKAPDIIGLHTAPPLPSLMNLWKSDLNLIVTKMIPEHSDAIIIGDFNATLRHGALNDIYTHEDALDYQSRFNRGTWPSTMPSIFETTIDHVLIPHNQFGVKYVNVFDNDSSDHRMVFVEIVRH